MRDQKNVGPIPDHGISKFGSEHGIAVLVASAVVLIGAFLLLFWPR